MKSGKTVVFLGCGLIILILFSSFVTPALSAYTETTTTQTNTVYFGPDDFSLESVASGSMYFYTEVCSVYTYSYSSQTSPKIPSGMVESVIPIYVYSREIVSGIEIRTVVSTIWRTCYVYPSSVPSSVPWWMTGPYSSKGTSANTLSLAPESIEIAEKSSSQASSTAPVSPPSSANSAISSEVDLVTSSVENLTASTTVSEPSSTGLNLISYWWAPVVAVILVFGVILIFRKKPNQE